MVDGSRQAGVEYRGVSMPEGMTRECMDALATLFNMHCHEDNEQTNEEAAVSAFEAVQQHRG
jgi:hypothetical protein